MKKGPWHQLGGNSQKVALDLLGRGAGVGVVISPKDLSLEAARKNAVRFRDLSADILVDHQFYNSSFNHKNLNSYFEKDYRRSLSNLKLSSLDLSDLSKQLEKSLRPLSVAGVVSPALKYQAGRAEISEVNARLFSAAKSVGNVLGVPTYATVTIDRSSTDSISSIESLLSDATGLDSDGWYYSFEFGEKRVPLSMDKVSMFCAAGLKLRITGKPVFHAFAGPMSILSYAFGVTATGIGYSQNLWQFSDERWQKPLVQRKNPKRPLRRFFSRNLWGTLVYPNEIAILDDALRHEALNTTEFAPLFENLNMPWDKRNADRHLVLSICQEVTDICLLKTPADCGQYAVKKLTRASQLYKKIKGNRKLRDNSDGYHKNWIDALEKFMKSSRDDLEYLNLVS